VKDWQIHPERNLWGKGVIAADDGDAVKVSRGKILILILDLDAGDKLGRVRAVAGGRGRLCGLRIRRLAFRFCSTLAAADVFRSKVDSAIFHFLVRRSSCKRSFSRTTKSFTVAGADDSLVTVVKAELISRLLSAAAGCIPGNGATVCAYMTVANTVIANMNRAKIATRFLFFIGVFSAVMPGLFFDRFIDLHCPPSCDGGRPRCVS
jgi:hypothetical protein